MSDDMGRALTEVKRQLLNNRVNVLIGVLMALGSASCFLLWLLSDNAMWEQTTILIFMAIALFCILVRLCASAHKRGLGRSPQGHETE